MLYENIKMAIAAIKAARFRSFLTMLGVIIGVISVITTASIGEGLKRQVSGQTRQVGQDLITIRPGKLVKRDASGQIKGVNLLSFLSSSVISEKDLKSVQNDSNIKSVAPFSVISGVPTLDGNRLEEGFIMATNENMPNLSGQKVEFGNFFSENEKNRRVAVIGQKVAEKLFKENVPVGKTMQIRGQDFVVNGVLEKTSVNPLSPEADYNNGVFIPYETGKNLNGGELQIYEILARPNNNDPAQINSAISSLNQSLKQNHEGEEDFTVLKQEDMVSVADNIVELVTKSVAIMAAIALLVGGVGIMNVMLVSVTERTREIGIRKAVGATNHQIHAQFLIEAIVISAWGAFIGIILSAAVNLLLRILTNLEPVISLHIVLIAALASILIGVIFGMIPALKASRKHPIDSLRSF